MKFKNLNIKEFFKKRKESFNFRKMFLSFLSSFLGDFHILRK